MPTCRRRLVIQFGRHRLMIQPGIYRFGFRRVSPNGACTFGLGLFCGNWIRKSTPPRYRDSTPTRAQPARAPQED